MSRFFSSPVLLLATLNNLFLYDCPNCKKMGYLRKHSLYHRVNPNGNDPIYHGQRFICCKRYKNKGCGKSFTLQLTIKLPRLNHLTNEINDFLLHYSDSRNAILSWKEKISYFIDICQPYPFLAFVNRAIPKLKGMLDGIKKPPDGIFASPVFQLIEQLKTIYPNATMICSLILKVNSRPF